jgi:hypothetical protein
MMIKLASDREKKKWKLGRFFKATSWSSGVSVYSSPARCREPLYGTGTLQVARRQLPETTQRICMLGARSKYSYRRNFTPKRLKKNLGI